VFFVAFSFAWLCKILSDLSRDLCLQIDSAPVLVRQARRPHYSSFKLKEVVSQKERKKERKKEVREVGGTRSFLLVTFFSSGEEEEKREQVYEQVSSQDGGGGGRSRELDAQPYLLYRIVSEFRSDGKEFCEKFIAAAAAEESCETWNTTGRKIGRLQHPPGLLYCLPVCRLQQQQQ
jgi:hypothetical protein